jgi:hypothetical protein
MSSVSDFVLLYLVSKFILKRAGCRSVKSLGVVVVVDFQYWSTSMSP